MVAEANFCDLSADGRDHERQNVSYTAQHSTSGKGSGAKTTNELKGM